MKIADLSPEVIEKIKTIRYDQILEKHEGPWKWESEFEFSDPEFIEVEGRSVLLPVERKQHANISILRVSVSPDDKLMTIFLKDTTYSSDPKWEWIEAGYLAICEKMPGQDFYVATLYHERFIVENPVLAE